MASPDSDRDSLVASVISVLRALNTYTVMVSQAAAERIGINTTDLHSLNILAFSPHEMNAGDLATSTGLTTASITGVIDRLENAGLVQRVRDPRDRRRVVVKVISDAAGARVAPVFAPLLAKWDAELAGYTEDELKLVLGYQTRILEIMQAQVQELRAGVDRA